jgi:ABC-2 type transport system permease protein
MNVFLYELRAFRKNTILWVISMSLLAVVFMSVFTAYSADAESFRNLFKGFPPEVLKAFGIDIDIVFSVLGYYSFIFAYVLLCGAIQAMHLGLSLITKEFNRKTADFIFTKPKPRASILTAKLMSGITLLLVTDIVYISVAYAMANITAEEPFDSKIFFMISISLFFVETMFYILGVLTGAIFHRIKSVTGVTLGTVFGFFIAGMLGDALDDEKIRYFVPFRYYDGFDIIRESGYDSKFVLINIFFVIAATLASYALYSKKDIHSA